MTTKKEIISSLREMITDTKLNLGQAQGDVEREESLLESLKDELVAMTAKRKNKDDLVICSNCLGSLGLLGIMRNANEHDRKNPCFRCMLEYGRDLADNEDGDAVKCLVSQKEYDYAKSVDAFSHSITRQDIDKYQAL